MKEEQPDDIDEGLVFDDTSEFVRSIEYNPSQLANTTTRTKAVDKHVAPAAGKEEREVGEVGSEDDDDETTLHAMQVDSQQESKDADLDVSLLCNHAMA